MRLLVYILLFLPLGVFAQQVLPYDVAANKNKPEVVAPPDTPPQPIRQGVIKVRAPKHYPYFKCEYYLTLANVREVQVPVETQFGVEMDKLPVFDSTIYSSSFERVYPQKEVQFSRQLADTIKYCYGYDDSARIDTMVVEMWIGTNGKVKWKDTLTTGNMPAALRAEMYRYAMSVSDWGKGGGFKEPKKFLRKQRRMAENYYCKLLLISSAKPLTAEQRHTKSRWAPFDIPLNSPPESEQQKDFMEGNRDKPANEKNTRK